MQPALARDEAFSHAISLLYGALSGIFLARTARLWRLSKHPEWAHKLVKPATPRLSPGQRAGLLLAIVVLCPVLLLAGLVLFVGLLVLSLVLALVWGMIRHIRKGMH